LPILSRKESCSRGLAGWIGFDGTGLSFSKSEMTSGFFINFSKNLSRIDI
jgi:hypothetical protein